MTFQQSLDLAELEADLAFEKYLSAFDQDEHPEVLDNLTTEAHLAQQRLDTISETDPAH